MGIDSYGAIPGMVKTAVCYSIVHRPGLGTEAIQAKEAFNILTDSSGILMQVQKHVTPHA
jgi:hypothetical protein